MGPKVTLPPTPHGQNLLALQGPGKSFSPQASLTIPVPVSLPSEATALSPAWLRHHLMSSLPVITGLCPQLAC